MNDIFDQFVKNQIKSANSQEIQLSIAQEKAQWLDKLDELYAFVERSLSEYTANQRISLDYNDVEITEEILGTYFVRQARIRLGRQVVTLKPIGTRLIGSRGRVDMQGPRGSTRFTLVPFDTVEPKVRPMTNSLQPADTPDAWVWKIATPPPRITYTTLSKEAFREALMDVVNG